MKSPKVNTPKVADPIPVPQTDSPEMASVQQAARKGMENQEGAANSLLTGGQGDMTDSGTQKKKLGSGSIAY
jgi:hypothetical protein